MPRVYASFEAEERARAALRVIPPEGGGRSRCEVVLQSSLFAAFAALIIALFLFRTEAPTVPSSDPVYDVVQVEVSQPPPAVVEIVTPPETEAVTVPAAALKAYTVQTGDTLWSLTGTHWSKVCQENRLRNCDLIFTGQTIMIPKSFLQEKEKRNE